MVGLMVKQRKTKNLGLNRSEDREKIYLYIENKLGIKEKLCARGNSKKEIRYKFNHEGPNPLPIRNFNLLKVFIDSNGEVIISSKDGLQSNCIPCERKFRTGRLLRYKKKYSQMISKEIYEEYKKDYRNLKVCSMCKQDKTPEEFPISRGMETGLHNTCKLCSKSYSESVGTRWIIYSPDGHNVLKITNKDKCKICDSKERLHKDHIWPLSKGGTDNKENIQILCGPHNLSKSAKIMGISFINEVKNEMICERYHKILSNAKENNLEINLLELKLSRAVKELIDWKKDLTNEKLKDFFEKEKSKNNRKHSIDHAIKKFRKYCDTAILEVNEHIKENLEEI